MTDDLDTLRPEVREALNRQDRQEKCDEYCPVCADRKTIRAELLRLVGDLNAACLSRDTFEAKYQCMRERAERAEAELAAIKARIAQSCRAYHSSFENTLDASTLYARATGVPGEQVFALVLVEE